jgi:type I restriction enzyme S subunit
LTEQTKIADFLSSVDEKIALLNKQYDLLASKKGMMQKIFSQEVRFKDEGKEFPGWDRKFIGNILKIGSNEIINI